MSELSNPVSGSTEPTVSTPAVEAEAPAPRLLSALVADAALPYVDSWAARFSDYSEDAEPLVLLSALSALRAYSRNLLETAQASRNLLHGSVENLVETIAPDGAVVTVEDDEDGTVTITVEGARLDDGYCLVPDVREFSVSASFGFSATLVVGAASEEHADEVAHEALSEAFRWDTVEVEGWEYASSSDSWDSTVRLSEDSPATHVGGLYEVTITGYGSVTRDYEAKDAEEACASLSSECCASLGRVYSVSVGHSYVEVLVSTDVTYEAEEV